MAHNSKLSLLQRAWRALERPLSPTRHAIAAPDAETLARMRTGFETMDEMQRAVFERARFDNLDYQQIGRELDLTTREVERHLASALLHIWRSTDGEEEE